MRKSAIILIITTVLALYGCKSTGEAENASVQNINTSVPEKSEVQNENISAAENPEVGNEKDTKEEPSKIQAENVIYTEVSQGGPYGKITLSLPDGWNYEVCPIDSGNMLYGMYGIHFYPQGIDHGYVEVSYIDFFGVCGTGLACRTATVAGHSAEIGTYDNHDYWDYIAFQGDYKGIVVNTYFVDDWWSNNSSQVMEILDTLSFDQSVKEGGAYIYDAESDINEIGLHFYLKNISSTGATLVYNQYDADAPTGELRYGEDFIIEVRQNNKWDSVPVIVEDDYGFIAVAYTITTKDQVESEISWEWLYGALKPGEYRIGKRINDFRKAGDYDSYMIYAHFILN